MIVDAHTHVFACGVGGPFNLPSGPEDLIREMDVSGVDVSIVLPLRGTASNEAVHRACARSAGRLVGLYNPDFTRGADALGDMASFFDVHAPKGLKIHPREQGLRLTDPLVREVLEWAAARCIPVLFDVFPYGQSLDDRGLEPLGYHRLAQELPSLPMVLGHAGGHRLLDAFMVAKSNPQVYLDISFTPVYFRDSSIAADCAFICRRLPPGRVLYGSDFPYVRFGESLATARALVDSADEPTRRAVMGTAAAQLFGLSARH